MTGPIRFQMPDGSEIIGETDGAVTMRITMPTDDVGYFGRRCPGCKRMFRIHAEDYKAQPDNPRLTCPYCCAEGDNSEFMTEQQVERALAAAGEYARQFVAGKVSEIFGNMERRVNSRGGAVRMRYSDEPSIVPPPLPAITEESPIRERICSACGIRYAIFGEHVACPVCGPFPPKVVAEDAIEAQDTILDLFDHVPAQTLEQLREAGALERTAASTLGAVVCILETFLKQTFLRQVIGGDSLIARRGNIFQRLDDTALLYRDHCGIDIPAILGAAEWDRLCLLYGVRHLATHTNAVVDARHVARFPSHGIAIGQRVSVSFTEAREALQIARTLIRGIA